MNGYKMNELGLMGEKVVINYLSSIGCIVEQSVNKYDSEKEDAPYIKFLKMLQKDRKIQQRTIGR